MSKAVTAWQPVCKPISEPYTKLPLNLHLLQLPLLPTHLLHYAAAAAASHDAAAAGGAAAAAHGHGHAAAAGDGAAAAAAFGSARHAVTHRYQQISCRAQGMMVCQS